MDTATAINGLANNGYGVWFGAEDSQRLVENPDAWPEKVAALDPQPSIVYVKFGGDWGGMWGDVSTWTRIRDEHPNVVPWLYCLPEQAARYAMLDAQLKGLGFRYTVFDVEFEWEHQQAALQSMLDSLNTDQNLCGLVGLAWFGGFGGYEGFRDVIARYPSLMYLPQAYLSELTNLKALPVVPGFNDQASTPLEYVNRWLVTAVPRDPTSDGQPNYSVVLDAASLDDRDAVEWWDASIAPSIWYSGAESFTQEIWAALPHRAPPPQPIEFESSDIEALNTNLGQALEWCDDLKGALIRPSDLDLVSAIQEALHTARKLSRGE